MLGSTPAALIAAGTDLKALGEVFELKSGDPADGLDWVDARPRQQDGQLQQVRVGLRQGQLVALEIADSLGQRSVLSFTQWQACCLGLCRAVSLHAARRCGRDPALNPREL